MVGTLSSKEFAIHSLCISVPAGVLQIIKIAIKQTRRYIYEEIPSDKIKLVMSEKRKWNFR